MAHADRSAIEMDEYSTIQYYNFTIALREIISRLHSGSFAIFTAAYMYIQFPISLSSVRRSPTMRPQQDFYKFSCSCWFPPLLSCSFPVEPLGFL